MDIKTFKIVLYVVSFLLGGLYTYLNINDFHRKNKEKPVIDYVYEGKSKEMLNFKKYSKDLFLSDSTVLKHKEGILATPKVVGEVAFAVLENVYSYNLAKFNYPYHIYSDVYTWNVYGTCGYSLKENEMLLGGAVRINIQRSNGMVTFIYKSY